MRINDTLVTLGGSLLSIDGWDDFLEPFVAWETCSLLFAYETN